MKKLFLVFALGANASLTAQGWVGNSGNNSVYPVNSTLGTTPINVGIGTNAPSAQLHTTSSVRFQGLINSDTPNRIIVQDVSGNLFWRNAASLGGGNNWSLIGNNNAVNPGVAANQNFLGTTTNHRLVIATGGVNAGNPTGPIERMTIMPTSGFVGVGTQPQNPSSLLTVGNGTSGLGNQANQGYLFKSLGSSANQVEHLGFFNNDKSTSRSEFTLSNSGNNNWEDNFLAFMVHGSNFSFNNSSNWYLNQNNSGMAMINAQSNSVTSTPLTKFSIGIFNNLPLSLYTNNTERIFIQGNGNVGIGTIVPNTRLEVAAMATLTNNSTADVGATINTSRSGLRINGLRSTTPTIPNPGTGLLSVDADGDVVLVNGGNSAINNLTCNDFIGSTNDINFRTNNSLQMKLNSDGNLVMNDGNQVMFGAITDCNTTPNWSIENWDNGLNFYKPFPSVNPGNYKLFLSENNDQVGVGIGNTPSWGRSLNWNWERFQVNGWGLADGWAIFSDERLKSNFRPISNPLNALMSINTYIYDYNKDQFDNVSNDSIVKKPISSGLTNRYGFKAQEVEKIFPDLVHSPVNESGYKSMDYIGFVPIIIEAFKELNAKVEKQNNAAVENEELKAKIAVMEEKFALLEKTITQLCESGCEGLKKPRSSSDADVLYQSIPNPTDSEALINYSLSREYIDASITVSSQDGKQLMTVKLEAKKGAGSIKINVGDLANGTYLYTLVAGERVIDTKRLQIVK